MLSCFRWGLFKRKLKNFISLSDLTLSCFSLNQIFYKSSKFLVEYQIEPQRVEIGDFLFWYNHKLKLINSKVQLPSKNNAPLCFLSFSNYFKIKLNAIFDKAIFLSEFNFHFPLSCINSPKITHKKHVHYLIEFCWNVIIESSAMFKFY